MNNNNNNRDRKCKKKLNHFKQQQGPRMNKKYKINDHIFFVLYVYLSFRLLVMDQNPEKKRNDHHDTNI